MKEDFAIVLVNYKSWKDTLECLESLLKMTYGRFKVFIVDNSNDDESILKFKDWSKGDFKIDECLHKDLIFPLIKKPFPCFFISEEGFKGCNLSTLSEKVILIKAKKNLGFAAGNNIVLNKLINSNISFTYVWLLNNDTIVKPNVLTHIHQEMKDSEKATIFGTPLMEYGEQDVVQAMGGRYNKIFGTTVHVGENIKILSGTKIKSCDIDYPIGASMLLTSSTLKTIGPLCEEYFLYFEELDWVSKLKTVGGGVKLIKTFGIFHKHGKSTQLNKIERNPITELLSIKNRINYAKKYNKGFVWSIKLSLLVVTAPKRLLRGDFSMAKKIIKMLFPQLFSLKFIILIINIIL